MIDFKVLSRELRFAIEIAEANDLDKLGDLYALKRFYLETCVDFRDRVLIVHDNSWRISNANSNK